MRSLKLLLIAMCLGGTDVHAERMLIPLSTQTLDGAFGSTWSTEVLIANRSDHPIVVKWARCAFDPCEPTFTVMPGVTLNAPVYQRPPHEPPGILLYVNDGEGQYLTVTNRIHEESRELFSWGTTIPVIRDGEFFNHPLNLLAIPLHERYRLSLRIYQDTNVPDMFTVRILSASGQVLGQHAIQTETLESPGTLEPLAPASVAIHSYDAILRSAVGASFQNVRLEITPANPTTRFWAFISVINNEAQHVTIITPE